ncbi:MAG: TRZ/ATZ family hydrolase [Candidatus Competibacteraceae bacterium]|nr:TRZ/ATZ family hydrolase [Candidatus Competibacteraceae bacterium]
MQIDTLIEARWIIPVEPSDTILEDHALAIRGGRIQALLPSREARQRFSPTHHFNLHRHVLIPGLVNVHTLAAMGLLRGLADDLPLMTWLNDHIWPAETRWVNPDFVADGTRLSMAEMLRGGITCFNDMYFFPDITAREVQACGMRAMVGLIVIDFPSAWAGSADEYLAKGQAVHRDLAGQDLVTAALAPHAPYTVGDGPLTRVRELAEELDVPIHIHVHETAFEVEQAQQQQGRRPLARLAELRLLSPRLLAVHMTQLNEGDIELMTAAGAHVAHCPESNLKLASGFCPVARLAAAGINVALGTDGAASNNDLDMLGEMRTAALLGKGVAGDAAALPAHRVLAMATLNGARALGLGEQIGSLSPGKWADITAVDLGILETEPLYNPVSALVYAASRQQVSDVWVAGRQLLRQRELTTLDIQAIRRRARDWQARIKIADQSR